MCGQQHVGETGQYITEPTTIILTSRIGGLLKESLVAEDCNGDGHTLADTTVVAINQM